MSVFNIDEVGWSEPRIVETKRGLRQVRTWKIPKGSPFWNSWRTGFLKEQGYSISKWNNEWVVTQWREPNGSALDGARLITAAARAQTVDLTAAENIVPVLPPILAARFEEVERVYDQIEADTGIDYRYQLPSIKRLALAIAAHGGALDASDTGTGKTPVACGVAKTLGRELFVVCPKSVIAPWHRIAALFDVPVTVINYELLRTGNTEFASIREERTRTGRKRRIFKWNTAVLDREALLMVFDDCHRMKDYTTWNCLMGVEALGAGFKVQAASATAADNPMQMKFVALLTGLIRHPAHFIGWMFDHGVKRGRFGLEFVGGREELSQIHRRIFPVRGSRIRIADLGDLFPQTSIIAESYDMGAATAEIREIYEEMHREIAKLEASAEKDRGANILTEILRARQRVELLKVPTLVDMAKDALEEGTSVVVILNFEDSVQATAKRLKTFNTITGQDRPGHRQNLIDRFNADDEELIVLNIKAGGVGISLQGRADGRPRLVLISPSYSGIDLKQALGRCWRAGGARSIQKIVFAAGTIEETACGRVRRKMNRIDLLNDNEITTLLAGL